MIIYVEVAHTTPYSYEFARGRTDLTELVHKTTFCRREYEHMYKATICPGDNVVICDEINIETSLGVRCDPVVHTVRAKVGEVTRSFHFANVIRSEIDEAN